jgi:hypothetical protein
MKHSITITLFALLSTIALAAASSNALSGVTLVTDNRVILKPTNAKHHGFKLTVYTEPRKMLTQEDTTNFVSCNVYSLVVESTTHDLTQFIPTMAYAPSDNPDMFIHSYLPSMPEAAPEKISFTLTVSPAAESFIIIVLRNRDARKALYRINLRDWKGTTEQESGHVRK